MCTLLFRTALTLLLAGMVPNTAWATVYTVTSTADSGPGTLRDAILKIVPYQQDTIVFDVPLPAIIDLQSELAPLIDDSVLTIQGPGAALLTITSSSGVRLMKFWSDGPHISAVTVSGLTFAYGGASLGPGLTLREAFGGAISTNIVDLTVRDCAFIGNFAFYAGGAIFVGGSALIDSSLFVGNWTFEDPGAAFPQLQEAGGGAIAAFPAGRITVRNSTLVGNSSLGGYDPMASAISIHGTATARAYLTVQNSIIWGNNGLQILAEDTDATISYSDIEGPWPSNVTDGGGNISADPLFVAMPSVGPDGIPGTADDENVWDLRLTAGSPAIDVGSNALVPGDLTTDLAGSPRIVNGTVDMGAYEFYTPSASVEALKAAVQTLVESGATLPASGQSLYAKLNAALQFLNAGDIPGAIASLQAFVNQVMAFVTTGRLTATQAQPLLDQAGALIVALGG